jgi:hypothetical protein
MRKKQRLSPIQKTSEILKVLRGLSHEELVGVVLWILVQLYSTEDKADWDIDKEWDSDTASAIAERIPTAIFGILRS